MKKTVHCICFLALLLAGCSQPKELVIQDAWARSGAAGENSAIYLQITNGTSADEVLTKVECDAATIVELHKSMMDGDIMKMEPLDKVPLQAGKKVVFEPGGLHVMLIGLQRNLLPGDEISVTLVFGAHDPIQISVPVKQP